MNLFPLSALNDRGLLALLKIRQLTHVLPFRYSLFPVVYYFLSVLLIKLLVEYNIPIFTCLPQKILSDISDCPLDCGYVRLEVIISKFHDLAKSLNSREENGTMS